MSRGFSEEGRTSIRPPEAEAKGLPEVEDIANGVLDEEEEDDAEDTASIGSYKSSLGEQATLQRTGQFIQI
jgi:hypothetical protein